LAYRFLRAFGVALLSLIIVAIYVQDVSLDFAPISLYFDEIREFRGFIDLFNYSLSGNMLAGIPFDYFATGTSDDKTLALYLAAAGIRALVVLYFIPPRYAIFYLFSSYVILELNQARLSIALSLLFLYIQSAGRASLILSGASHLSLLPILPLYAYRPRKLLIPFFILVVIAVLLSANIFPRYFAGSHGSGVPLNTFLYFGGASVLYFFLWQQGEYVHDYIFFLFFTFLILSLTYIGFSTVYVGRISELCWHIGAFRFLAHFSNLERAGGNISMTKNRVNIVLCAGCAVMFALGIYRFMLLSGNIWSYF
jgi:hypothetical protein